MSTNLYDLIVTWEAGLASESPLAHMTVELLGSCSRPLVGKSLDVN
jgi:hypothetical protein